jgi:hypothetical protein
VLVEQYAEIAEEEQGRAHGQSPWLKAAPGGGVAPSDDPAKSWTDGAIEAAVLEARPHEPPAPPNSARGRR